MPGLPPAAGSAAGSVAGSVARVGFPGSPGVPAPPVVRRRDFEVRPGRRSLRDSRDLAPTHQPTPRSVSYLEKHQGSAEYLVAVTGSQTAAPIILSTGKPVIAMGGFNGGDPAPTLAQFKTLVATGKVHYVVVGGVTGAGATLPGATLGGGFPGGAAGGFPGGGRGSFPRPSGAGSGPNGFPPGGGAGGFPGGATGSFPGGRGGGQAGPGGQSSTVSAIDAWVTSHGTKVSYGSSGGGTLYFVSSAAAT